MISKFKIGEKAYLSKVFTEADVILFAKLSLDINPLHLDKDFAMKTIFKKRIVHGMLVSSLFSAIIANNLPGPGSIYLSQELNFKKPVFLNEEVLAEVEIINIRKDKPIITLKTICYNMEKQIVIEGEAIVLIHQ